MRYVTVAPVLFGAWIFAEMTKMCMIYNMPLIICDVKHHFLFKLYCLKFLCLFICCFSLHATDPCLFWSMNPTLEVTWDSSYRHKVNAALLTKTSFYCQPTLFMWLLYLCFRSMRVIKCSLFNHKIENNYSRNKTVWMGVMFVLCVHMGGDFHVSSWPQGALYSKHMVFFSSFLFWFDQ